MDSGSVKKWILVVDDEPEIVDIVLKLLEMNFSDVAKFVSARDGMDATSRLNFQAFDCIITDMRMPKRDGNAFIDAVKNNPLNQSTPIVILSANPDYVHTDKYPDIKILEKPIDTDALISIVGQELKLGKTDQRLEAGLLNGFVSGFHKFFRDLLDVELTQGTPLLKAARHPIPDEVFYFLRVQSGKVFTSFLFGFSKKTIEVISAKVSPEGGAVDIAKILEVSGGLILQNALKEVSSSDLHVLNKIAVVEGKSSAEVEALKVASDEKGIVIPLSTDVGHINIYVLW